MPPPIRVFGLQTVTQGFSSHLHCTGRLYQYYLPTYALLPQDVYKTLLPESVAPSNPSKELMDEGLAQLFTFELGARKVVGTVGVLQFEVLQHRLLNEYADHVKNYRPKILVLSGIPAHRLPLVDFAHLITKKLSLVIFGHVAKNEPVGNLDGLKKTVK